jgi:hypothetical protein
LSIKSVLDLVCGINRQKDLLGPHTLFFKELVNLSYQFKKTVYQNNRTGYPFKREICMIVKKRKGGFNAWALAADFRGKLFSNIFCVKRQEVKNK